MREYPLKTGMRWMLGLLLAGAAAGALAGESGADTATRIQQLEAMMQQMLAQRTEQDRQMQAVAAELQAMRQQIAQGREDAPKEPAKRKGEPVLASFKNGIVFEDGSGNWQLAINGRIQADGRAFNPDPAAADTWSLRRARLGAVVTFHKDYAVRVEGEYSGSGTTLTYGHLDINRFKAARLRIGQFKPQYGLERSLSSNFLDFLERSMADALLGGTFDRGVMLHGAPLDGLYYSAAWINGSNGDENDVEYDNKDLMARVTGNLARFAGWKDAVVHVGGFYSHGRQESGSAIPVLQTEARGYRLFETDNNNRLTDSVDRTRGGIELALARGPFKLQGEYIRAGFDGRDFHRDMSAWYASLNWLVSGERFADAYREGVFGRISPKQHFAFGGAGWGALQLGVRYSRFDGDDFVTGNATGTGKLAAGRSNGADAWTLGANWILNPNLRLAANYVHTHFDSEVSSKGVVFGDEDAITMRAQFDF